MGEKNEKLVVEGEINEIGEELNIESNLVNKVISKPKSLVKHLEEIFFYETLIYSIRTNKQFFLRIYSKKNNIRYKD